MDSVSAFSDDVGSALRDVKVRTRVSRLPTNPRFVVALHSPAALLHTKPISIPINGG
jgi:hypothetical protein